MNEAIERRIEEILAMPELSAQALSHALFGPNGLFNQLASSEVDRRSVVRSPLFQRANKRLTDLQHTEVAELAQAAAQRRASRIDNASGEVNGAPSAQTAPETSPKEAK